MNKILFAIMFWTFILFLIFSYKNIKKYKKIQMLIKVFTMI
jgi:hypothetical protein